MVPNLKSRLLAVALAFLPALAVAETAEHWLDRMSMAARTLSYEGTFVYLQNGQLEAMRIFHQAGEAGEQERLISLNGSAREVLRDNERVTCILPDNQSVMVDRSRPRRPFPTALPRDLGELASNYDLQVLGEDRMAGKDTRIIAIKPRDNLRYGYRLWLDKHTDMLLKSDLTDAEGRPVEQVMFTQFTVHDKLPREQLLPSLGGGNYTWHEEKPGTAEPEKAIETRWKIASLPSGFMLVHQNRHSMPMNPRKVEHLVYSDGLATVSMYVEPSAQAGDSLKGVSNMGAVNAYGGQVDGYQVTVVGEVPRVTVELIGQSARLVE